ncbi:hypothetical protein DFH08DRAFT_957817 [Mycena albidolilacea]|uniref:Uncharacterized protein n=1 Tax=Mycena albidolilacea TaxID=1033008 RepID=A0AAD7A7U5_9AGAR|nr:hypothetical protein DFH08DRAFT_957817 [Mycena albidolilacea]
MEPTFAHGPLTSPGALHTQELHAKRWHTRPAGLLRRPGLVKSSLPGGRERLVSPSPLPPSFPPPLRDLKYYPALPNGGPEAATGLDIQGTGTLVLGSGGGVRIPDDYDPKFQSQGYHLPADMPYYTVHGARMLEALDTTGYTGSLSTTTTHVSLLIDDRYRLGCGSASRPFGRSAVLEHGFVLGARLPLPPPCSALLTPLSDPSPRSCIPPPVPPSQPRHPPRWGARHCHAVLRIRSSLRARRGAICGIMRWRDVLETSPRVRRDGLPREQADIARQGVLVAGARKGDGSSMRRGRCLQVKPHRRTAPASPAGTHLDEFRAHHPDECIGVYLHSLGCKARQALRSLGHLSKKLIMPTSL